MANTIKAEFETADANRQLQIERSRECAAFTIPTVLPPLNTREGDEILRPYQSVGADGVVNLVSKLLLSILPPGQPWFAHTPSAAAQTDRSVTPEQLAAFEALLYARDLQIAQTIEAIPSMRPKVRAVLEGVIIAGTSLIYVNEDLRLRIYRLDQFVQRRGGDGELIWTICRDRKDPAQLSEAVKQQTDLANIDASDPYNDERFVMYTRSKRQGDAWLVEQELNGHIITTSEERVNPFIVVGYTELVGENYSRSFIEDKLGDLRSFNGLSYALLIGALLAAKCNPVVDPNKGWIAEDLAKSNGEVLEGRVDGGTVDGVGWIRVDKANDFSVAFQQAGAIETRLKKQMMMESSVQRNAERVTATEILSVARELESGLGGAYSNICDELQAPLLARVEYVMERKGMLLPLPESMRAITKREIRTGIAALTRQMDQEKVQAMLQALSVIPGAMERVRMDVLLMKLFEGMGIDIQTLIKTPQEVQAEQQAAVQQQIQIAAGQEAAKAGGAIAVQSAAQPTTGVMGQ